MSSYSVSASEHEEHLTLVRDQENLIAHVRDITILEVECAVLLANVQRIQLLVRQHKIADHDLREEVKDFLPLGGDAVRDERYRKKVRLRARLAREIEDAENILDRYERELAATEKRLSRLRQSASSLRQSIGEESARLGGYIDMDQLEAELVAAAGDVSAAADTDERTEELPVAVELHALRRLVADQSAELAAQEEALAEQERRIKELEDIVINPDYWYKVMTR